MSIWFYFTFFFKLPTPKKKKKKDIRSKESFLPAFTRSWNPLPLPPGEAHKILAQHLASARSRSYYYGMGGEEKLSRYQGGFFQQFFFLFFFLGQNISRLAYTILQNLLQAAEKTTSAGWYLPSINRLISMRFSTIQGPSTMNLWEVLGQGAYLYTCGYWICPIGAEPYFRGNNLSAFFAEVLCVFFFFFFLPVLRPWWDALQFFWLGGGRRSGGGGKGDDVLSLGVCQAGRSHQQLSAPSRCLKLEFHTLPNAVFAPSASRNWPSMVCSNLIIWSARYRRVLSPSYCLCRHLNNSTTDLM